MDGTDLLCESQKIEKLIDFFHYHGRLAVAFGFFVSSLFLLQSNKGIGGKLTCLCFSFLLAVQKNCSRNIFKCSFTHYIVLIEINLRFLKMVVILIAA